MEVWLSSLCFIALSTVVALWFLRLLSGRKNKPKKHLPPGPWTLPIIGSLHHVVSALPHRRLMELSRRHGPLMLLKLGDIPTLIVSDAEAAELVLKTNDVTFAGRPLSTMMGIAGCGGKGIVFAPYGDHWRQMRKVCIVELLSSKQVKRLEGIRAEEVGNLLHSITASNGATINFSQKATALSNDILSRAVFGGKFTHQEEYIHALHDTFTLLGGFYLVDLFPTSRLVRWMSNGENQMKRCCGRMQRIIAQNMEGRKAPGAAGRTRTDDEEDLLDVLLRLQEEDSLEFPLTTETISVLLFDVFAGATETTGNVLAWTMSELVRNPECMARAQQEVREVLGEDRVVIANSDLAKLHYMRMVIKEALRLHSPIPLVQRSVREDCTIKGYNIPEGANVFVNVFAIAQDPIYWKNPEEFKPERFENKNVNYNGADFEFIPFGAGRRQCPGIQYSSSLIEMALTNLLYHFDWKLPDGVSLASFDMSEKFGLTLSRRSDLQVRAIPHVGSNAMSSR